jgi:NodT family efflux transporter outer membrane factor (OMF) lipoprotein
VTTRLRRSIAAALAVVLAGCAVGPDFARPPAPTVPAYTDTGTPERLSAGPSEPTQQTVVGDAIATEWWELFRSPPLADAVKDALAGNQTLANAEATLAQAEEAVVEARAAFFPQIDFTGSAERQQTAQIRRVRVVSSPVGAGGRALANIFSLGPTVTYSPDVFGLTRRQVEQQGALAASQACQLAAAYLTLTGNVVSQAIAVAGSRRELEAVEQEVAEDRENLDLVHAEFDAGKAARVDVLSAETQLATDETQLPPLRQQLEVARHALSVLLGRPPADWSPPDFDLTALELPGELPVSVPSTLVHQRPDILSAEGQLHAASAAIGVATAQLYPQFTLSASFSQEATATGPLFQGASSAWTLASSMTAPLFHGGALTARRRGAIDAFQASLATYRETMLQAFQQVADTLTALEHDAELVGEERQALDVAVESATLQRFSYREGKSSLLQLLDAERLEQQARLGYARAVTQRYQDTTQLFVAMGGRWWEAALGADVPALCAVTPA